MISPLLLEVALSGDDVHLFPSARAEFVIVDGVVLAAGMFPWGTL